MAESIGAVCARAEKRDAQIQALVAEQGRAERLQAAAAALASRYPAGSEKPPLFAVPIGVKDIFRVDLLPTRAG